MSQAEAAIQSEAYILFTAFYCCHFLVVSWTITNVPFSFETHMQPIINHNLLCTQCPNKHHSSGWCHALTTNNEDREILGTNGTCVQTCTNEMGHWLTVYTLKQSSNMIPEALVSPIIFPLNMKLFIFPLTIWRVAEMFTQMEGLHY
jgi:hypothetical protein